MQPIKRLANGLAALASSEHYLFSPSDLRVLLADLSDQAFKTLLTRAVSAGLLQRVCRGIYLYPQTSVPQGLVLYHAAARLRAGAFNYLSLESVLSEAGVISQVPLNWITVMSSGRSSIIPCAQWGSIEFVHTARTPDAVAPALQYDVAAICGGRLSCRRCRTCVPRVELPWNLWTGLPQRSLAYEPV